MKILLAEADGAPAGRLFHLLVKNLSLIHI